MFKAYFDCIKKYATFRGRARRREFWLFGLFNFLFCLLLAGAGVACMATDHGAVFEILYIVMAVYSIFILLPGLAVSVRRMHDSGHSGAYLLMALIPIAGPILVLVAVCTDSVPGENQYGPNPKESAESVSRIDSSDRVTPVISQENIPTNRVDKKPLETAIVKKSVRAVCISGPNAGKGAEGEVIYIGRDPSLCQLPLSGVPGVSKVHCMLHAEPGGIEVRDLGSTYGTYLPNGAKLEANASAHLPDGGTLMLGSPNTKVVVEIV